MKHNAVLLAGLIILAGCNQASAPSPSPDGAGEPVGLVAAPDAPISCPEDTGYQILPANLALSIPYHLRADRIYVNKHDAVRRRVVLEFLEGDAATTLASVDRSMVAAGFTARPRREQPNGNIIVPYARKDYGSITVVASALPGDNPSNPMAKGTIAFDFPGTQAAPAPATVQ